jgi:protein arginine kinase activator
MAKHATLSLDLFADGPLPSPEDPRVCPHCGTSRADLHTDGRMGCAKCYQVFSDEVHRALIVLHGSNHHVGKTLNS